MTSGRFPDCSYPSQVLPRRRTRAVPASELNQVPRFLNQTPRIGSLTVRSYRRPTSPAYSCGPGVLTQSNASGRVPHRSFSTQAYLAGVLVRRGVLTQSSTSSRVPHRFSSTQAYITGVLVRRGVLTQSAPRVLNQSHRIGSLTVRSLRRPTSPAYSPTSPAYSPSSPAYSCGRGVLTQSSASGRVPDCSFSTQAYESRL